MLFVAADGHRGCVLGWGLGLELELEDVCYCYCCSSSLLVDGVAL